MAASIVALIVLYIMQLTSCVIADYAEENTVYLELRTTPKTTDNFLPKDYVLAILDEIDKAKLVFPNCEYRERQY